MTGFLAQVTRFTRYTVARETIIARTFKATFDV